MNIASGLYRTTSAHPLAGQEIPAATLVFVGTRAEGDFVVRPHYNENNRWYWREPVTPLASDTWAATLIKLPSEGFYTLPRAIEFEGGAAWLENAIVQLGYNREGEGILFVAERREGLEDNALLFSDRGVKIEDELLFSLRWAPILPVREVAGGPLMH